MDIHSIVDNFVGEALILGAGSIIKSGKEATVYSCAAHPSTGVGYAALKVYKDIERRSFRDMANYMDGRIGTSLRKRRDILHTLSTPSELQAFWVDTEFRALETLYAHGLPVPRPLGRSPEALVMELVGGSEPAPQLRELRLGPDEARRMRSEIIDSIREMLSLDLIHGDLSAYNILVCEGMPCIIDFPQVIDSRYHSRGREMLERDLVNVLGYFEGRGCGSAEEGRILASEWWALYERNRL